jgi:hypothetical protein
VGDPDHVPVILQVKPLCSPSGDLHPPAAPPAGPCGAQVYPFGGLSTRPASSFEIRRPVAALSYMATTGPSHLVLHTAITSSSRSNAWRTGTWQDQPCLRQRPPGVTSGRHAEHYEFNLCKRRRSRLLSVTIIIPTATGGTVSSVGAIGPGAPDCCPGMRSKRYGASVKWPPSLAPFILAAVEVRRPCGRAGHPSPAEPG